MHGHPYCDKLLPPTATMKDGATDLPLLLQIG